ncbi:MAG: UDP-N-acetylmuramoylalanyl-D-glutamyl-2,6-diaminopimelate--D-alanyl-D-alanine ligase [Alphaproteobacteria bacterium]|nr:MAG: UDP-N-acetylmuramoylalanyl-D-glutamyl-2,6-diaminopimelate--D-alanyl-D-alanine ligase [Alphaproteobacteria bacterium]
MSNRPLWTSQEMVEATGGKVTGGDWTADNVTIDSRSSGPGDLFVAIQGLSRDGHEFVAMAEEAEVAGVMISRADMVADLKGPSLLVEDTLEGLNGLGRFARARVDAKVIAVTGSVGKTGTKESLKLALTACGCTHASAASYNNLWGVPLSLARMPAETEFGIFEIGMNHAGEIIPLTQMVRPDVAIVTTVAPVHLEFFDNVEAIAEAKAEIFQGLKRGGVAVLNRDNPHFDLLNKRAEECGAGEIIGFGESEKAQARLLSYGAGEEGTDVEADICGTRIAYRIGASGYHWALNSLAVLAAVHAVGADVAAAAAALAGIEPPKGRGAEHYIETKDGRRLVLVDESYNANPASMAAAFKTLGARAMTGRGRRIAVIGDMRELGGTSQALHAALNEPILAAGVDLVFCCGPHMKALWEALPKAQQGAYAPASEELIQPLLNELKSDDVVMVKGSLGTNMAPIVKAVEELKAPAAVS